MSEIQIVFITRSDASKLKIPKSKYQKYAITQIISNHMFLSNHIKYGGGGGGQTLRSELIKIALLAACFQKYVTSLLCRQSDRIHGCTVAEKYRRILALLVV